MHPIRFSAAMQCACLALALFALQPCTHAAAAKPAIHGSSAAGLQSDQLLARWYGPGQPAAAWTHSDQVQQALEVLRGADAHGLDPKHYGIDALEQAMAAGAEGAEQALSRAMLRFLADLHFGRVEPQVQLAAATAPLQRFDPVEHLRWALRQPRLADAIEAAAPAIPLYQGVKTSLRQYRELAAVAPPWTAPELPRGGKLVDGRSYPGLGLLRERLRLLGDLDQATDDQEPDRYGADLIDALKRFQARHGLPETGKLGPETLAALAVPLAQRVRQLELTLERLRWMPQFKPGRMIVVNVPAFRLWAFDTAASTTVEPVEMRVIVGHARRSPTPLFIGQLRYMEFNPYWNVPPSIAKEEILPRLAREPDYLENNAMELVSPDGLVQHGVDADTLAALKAGKLRVRQTPGAHNALGAVKFAMPNPMNIYLHSTSAKKLFGRSRRDLSHGCIRLEHPAGLAAFVLADQPEWTPKAIAAAMAPGPVRTVRLSQTIPVVLFYATAGSEPSGRTVFAADIYGRDPILSAALERD